MRLQKNAHKGGGPRNDFTLTHSTAFSKTIVRTCIDCCCVTSLTLHRYQIVTEMGGSNPRAHLATIFDIYVPMALYYLGASFDQKKGFTVYNGNAHNVYLQVGTTNDFEEINAKKTSSTQTKYGEFHLRNDDKTDADLYLTITIDDGNGSLLVTPGAQKGNFTITSNYS